MVPPSAAMSLDNEMELVFASSAVVFDITHHFLDAHSHGELGVSVTKLVYLNISFTTFFEGEITYINGDHVSIIIKLDEALEKK